MTHAVEWDQQPVGKCLPPLGSNRPSYVSLQCRLRSSLNTFGGPYHASSVVERLSTNLPVAGGRFPSTCATASSCCLVGIWTGAFEQDEAPRVFS